MNFDSNCTSLKLILLLSLCFNTSFYAYSQFNIASNSNLSKERFYVKWVEQIPSFKEQKEPQKFKNKFFNFILGKKTSVLNKPMAVCLYTNDSIIILDQGCQSILVLNMKQGELSHYIDKKTIFLPSLISICSTTDTNFLFTDSKLNKVFVINRNTKIIKEFNDLIVFQHPTGIAYSSINKEVWVVETSAHRISVFDKDGNLNKTIGGRGNSPGKFNFPTFIWIDASGLVYVVDSLNFRVQIFKVNGELISVFGQSGDASGYFARPKGIATDSYGNIYVVDALFNVVQIFDKSGKFLYQFGSQGQGEGQFWMPTGIYIDKNNYIYVADTYNSRIQIFQLIKED